MPTPWGTDNSDEDYAPHMYIQHQFIGEAAEVEIDGIEYRVGVSEDSGKPKVICETVDKETYEATALAVKDFPEKARVKLLEYLASEDSINMDPESQEHIRRAFGFPKEALAESLRQKQRGSEELDAFIQSASGGREDVNTAKQRRRAKRKAMQ